MADADLTYDFGEIPRFVTELQAGAELVMGDRMDNIQPGAMPWLHRYVGNPLLSGLLNLFFRTGVKDAHCGMRALRRDVLPRLDLRTTGMEFASEMVIRASKENLRIAEFPIEYHPRGGESKLSSFRDGWRHLRFLLVHSPTHLFILPGLVLSGLGLLLMILVAAGLSFFGRAWGLHALIGGALLTIVGTQILALGLCAHAYGTYFMGERDPWFDRMRARFRLEHGLLLGGLFMLAGLIMGTVVLVTWISNGFGAARLRAARAVRRRAADRRHPDLLLLLPAVDPRSAPALGPAGARRRVEARRRGTTGGRGRVRRRCSRVADRGARGDPAGGADRASTACARATITRARTRSRPTRTSPKPTRASGCASPAWRSRPAPRASACS